MLNRHQEINLHKINNNPQLKFFSKYSLKKNLIIIIIMIIIVLIIVIILILIF